MRRTSWFFVGIAVTSGCLDTRTPPADAAADAALDAALDATVDATADAITDALVTESAADTTALCGAGLAACGGACVDLATDMMNCGACGVRCSAPNARAACDMGACVFRCDEGFADCDRVASNGCEASLGAPTTCGSCDRRCGGATPNCQYAPGRPGMCVGGCAMGFGDCDNNAMNGCETPLISMNHCGACDRPCRAPANGSANCMAGACEISCNPGYYASGTDCVAVLPPRPLAPISAGFTTSTRPTFTWVNPAGNTGVEVLVCRDRRMTSGCVRSTVMARSYRPTAPLASGWWFWSLGGLRGTIASATRSAVWQFRVRASDSPIDSSYGSVVDFDGDGFADVVTGAPNTPIAGATHAGAVYFYEGSATGLAADPAREYVGAATDRLGLSVAAAGDINGDGFADVMLGAPEASFATGYVGVVLGNARGLPSTFSSTLRGATSNQRFGSRIAAIGDVNGDGYGDVAIASSHASGPSVVEVFLGSASGSLIAHRTYTFDRARLNAAYLCPTTLGDLNLDGYSDFAIANPGDPGGGSSYGTIQIFYGSATGASATPAQTIAGVVAMEAPATTLSYGDFNGDGRVDLLAGSNFVDEAGPNRGGVVRLYLATATGLPSTPSQEHRSADSANFGIVVSGGDVDSDGYDDALIGAPFTRCGGIIFCGAVELRLGSAAGIATTPQRRIVGNAVEYLGTSVGARGDINNDGFADVVFGAPNESSTAMDNAGALHVHHGSSTGIAASLTTSRSNGVTNSAFGHAATL
ncbi:MAG: FG-GAP repeat protein [Myxococcales bacterium]|nr:FG-GAP repeat protein [Myxococcales bacterium]